MNREILFRGKRLDNGEWVEGFYLKGHTGDTYIAVVTDIPFADFDFIPVDSSTIGQYTGLADKNGVKIFEGDIYRSRDGVRLFEIRYLTEYARFAGVRPGTVFSAEMLSGVEVIGNIHDNPELVGGDSNA